MEDSELDPQQQAGLTKNVKYPAIALIVLGGLGVLMALADAAMQLYNGGQSEQQMQELSKIVPPEVMKIVENMSGGVALALDAVYLLLAGFVIFSGAQMLRGRMWLMCVIASVLVCIPCCGLSCCCWPLGLPIGIWSLVALLNANNKRAFH